MATPEFSTIVQESPSGATLRIAQRTNPLWHFVLVYDYLKDNPNDVPPGTGQAPYTDLETLLDFYNARYGAFDDFLLDCSILGLGSEWYSVIDQSQILVPATITTDTTFTQWFTPIQRSAGGQFAEDITDINPNGPVTVMVNGIAAQTSRDYFILGRGLTGNTPTGSGFSYAGLYLYWQPWQKSFPYTLGTMFIDPAGHLQIVTTAGGNSGTTIPTFDDSGSTTTDGGTTWTDNGLAAVRATFDFYLRMRFEEDTQDFEAFMGLLWTIGGGSSKSGSGQLKMVSSRGGPPGLATGSAGSTPITGPGGPTLAAGTAFAVLLPNTFSGPESWPGGFGCTPFPQTAGAAGTGWSSLGGVEVHKGPISRALSDNPVQYIGSYALPPGIGPSQVTKVWAVASGQFSESDICGEVPCGFGATGCWTPGDQAILLCMVSTPRTPVLLHLQHLIYNGIIFSPGTGAVQSPPDPNIDYFNTSDPFIGTSTMLLSPTSTYSNPADLAADLPQVLFYASLAQTTNQLCDADFGGTMIIVIEYTLP